MQLCGDNLAHRGFARSHETDERYILNLALGAHWIELADLTRVGTQFFDRTEYIEHRTPNIERRR
jgi:hypothetical protein